MPQERFTLKSLADMQVHAATFEKLLRELVADAFDRDTDPTPRKLIIEIAVAPKMKKDKKSFSHLETTIDYKAKRPTIKSNAIIMKPDISTVGGCKGMIFNPDLPDDPDGESIADIADREAAKKK